MTDIYKKQKSAGRAGKNERLWLNLARSMLVTPRNPGVLPACLRCDGKECVRDWDKSRVARHWPKETARRDA